MTPSLQAILRAVSPWVDVSIPALLGKDRHKHIVRGRHVLYAVARRYGYSYPAIAKEYGWRDHTSIINGVKRIEGAIANGDAKLAELVNSAFEACKEELPEIRRAPVVWWPCCEGAGMVRCA